MHNTNPEITRLAEEIARYITAHPSAADTLEGITNWWLRRLRFEESAEQVQKAIDHLIRVGIIKSDKLPNGTVLYRKAP